MGILVILSKRDYMCKLCYILQLVFDLWTDLRCRICYRFHTRVLVGKVIGLWIVVFG